MRNEELRQLFDAATNLEDGQVIRISCESRSEQDSIRSQFYKERVTYRNLLKENAREISISKVTLNDTAARINGDCKYFVVLKVVPSLIRAVIVSPDGTEKQIVSRFEENEEGLTPEQQRIYDLMTADGMTHEDALSYIKED